MRIVFLGPPGVGKGTQSTRLASQLRIAHLSTGEMLRQAHKRDTPWGMAADGYMSAGQLVPDELMLQMVSSRLTSEDCHAGYLLDGFPRTLRQAQEFDRYLADRGTRVDCVLEIVVNPEEIVKRLASRGREDDRPEIVRRRLDEYKRQTSPLSRYYRERGLLVEINGEGTIDEVFERVRLAAEKFN